MGGGGEDNSRATHAFNPYGKPPPFDLNEYKDSSQLWEKQWHSLSSYPRSTPFWTETNAQRTNAISSYPAYQSRHFRRCLKRTYSSQNREFKYKSRNFKNHCNVERSRHVFRRQNWRKGVDRPGKGKMLELWQKITLPQSIWSANG